MVGCAFCAFRPFDLGSLVCRRRLVLHSSLSPTRWINRLSSVPGVWCPSPLYSPHRAPKPAPWKLENRIIVYRMFFGSVCFLYVVLYGLSLTKAGPLVKVRNPPYQGAGERQVDKLWTERGELARVNGGSFFKG